MTVASEQVHDQARFAARAFAVRWSGEGVSARVVGRMLFSYEMGYLRGHGAGMRGAGGATAPACGGGLMEGVRGNGGAPDHGPLDRDRTHDRGHPTRLEELGEVLHPAGSAGADQVGTQAVVAAGEFVERWARETDEGASGGVADRMLFAYEMGYLRGHGEGLRFLVAALYDELKKRKVNDADAEHK